jgi:crotonobetaine/carnitine-CoA ligase
MDLGSFLGLRARKDGSSVFAFCKNASITLFELYERSRLLARTLISKRVRKGDRVAIISHPSLDYLVTEFAVWMVGAICVPINPNLKAHEFEYFRSNSGYNLAFLHPNYLPEFEKSNERNRIPYLIMGEETDSQIQSHKSEIEDNFHVKVEPADAACILYTSGTTGAPKGVIYEHYGLLPFHNETYVQQMMDVIGLSSKDTTYLPFPLHHILGQVHVIGALRNGGKIVLAERFSVSQFWEDVRRFGATVLVHQGASIPLLLKQPPSSKDKDHQARISVGAGVPNENVWREFEARFGVKVFEHYAQTEGSFFGAGTMPTNRHGTIGKEYSSAEVRIVDENDSDVPEGSSGQLISRLKKEFSRKKPSELYFMDPQRGISRFTQDGWFRSGDIVRRDNDGYFHYVGKVEAFIRYRGENISPMQIETVLATNQEIDECIAVGVRNSELGGDDIKLVVVPKRGAHLDPQDIFEWCKDRLPKFMLPRFIEIVPELRKSDQTKKVLRHEYLNNSESTWDRTEQDA